MLDNAPNTVVIIMKNPAEIAVEDSWSSHCNISFAACRSGAVVFQHSALMKFQKHLQAEEGPPTGSLQLPGVLNQMSVRFSRKAASRAEFDSGEIQCPEFKEHRAFPEPSPQTFQESFPELLVLGLTPHGQISHKNIPSPTKEVENIKSSIRSSQRGWQGEGWQQIDQMYGANEFESIALLCAGVCVCVCARAHLFQHSGKVWDQRRKKGRRNLDIEGTCGT